VYEVESKFRVADGAALERRLAELGAVPGPAAEQVDRYFAHPCRDFARSDEALRLRRTGDDVAITWKGPRIDATTKTRRELELALAAAGSTATTLERWTELLAALGFRVVRDVVKRRRVATVPWQGREVEVALDAVAGLGEFVELELRADAADVPAASACVAALAAALGCGASERRSYLELLLAAG